VKKLTQQQTPQIRRASALDSDAIWNIFDAVVVRGDTYTFDPGIGREEGLAYWLHPSNRCYVAEHEGKLVGSYILRANQPGLGAHVANAGFMVAPGARGLGVGRSMGEHSLSEARRLGFRAMQFNFVVSTNEPAIRLWHQLGFKIVGTLPGVFRHREKGFVDAYVMFCSFGET
jgi:ribosomal protein S18 acetylase RimI-like enzyme